MTAYLRSDKECAVVPVVDWDEIATSESSGMLGQEFDRIEVAFYLSDIETHDNPDGLVWIGFVANDNPLHVVRFLVAADALKEAIEIAIENPVPE